MRVPSIERRPRLRNRIWIVVGLIALLLLVLLLSLRGLAGFYTDYLWFDEVHFSSVWRGLLLAKIVPAAVFTVVFFVVMLVSLMIADRLAPRIRTMGAEDELLDRYQQVASRYAGRIRLAVAAFFALIMGGSVAGEWQAWILFRNRVDFRVTDPQFHKDIGFYVFQLPFIKYVIDWMFSALVIVFIVTVVAHYLNGGIRLQSPYQRVTPQVKAHLSVLLALMALVKAVDYYFAQYALNFSTRGAVQGASYTDVHAQLRALHLLIFIAVIAAGLFIWNIWRRGWVLPIIAVGLWALLSLLVGTIYPAFVQNFRVKPNELAKEKAYILRNIHATRVAFGLDDIKVNQFSFQNNLDATAIAGNSQTVNNARLWDPAQLQANYRSFQAISTFFQFGDVDVDRYRVDGKVVQVLLSARELNRENLPSQTWVSRHLVYTHGYGLAVSPSNSVSPDGSPAYLLNDLPPRTSVPSLVLRQPRIYFGENLGGYALADGKQPEVDFKRENAPNQVSRYKGQGGVELSSWLRRAAFALRFGDFNVLISGQITSSSRVMFLRDITTRVHKAAPFLRFDADPYPVIVGGRTVWILDGYTTTDRYPYAQAFRGENGLAGRVNYVRNSVKATVDAYDGSIKLYVIDPKDPIIRAYRKAFPSLFTDFSKMPGALKEHLRYPEDLFRLQTDVYASYHMTNPATFYNRTDLWAVSPDPGSGAVTPGSGAASDQATSSTGTENKPRAAGSTGRRIDPLYLLIRLPDQPSEDFLILRPFVPVSSNNALTQLVSFMVAKSDPGRYGQLASYVMPSGATVTGPDQANSFINNTRDISQQFTLLNGSGSTVIQGSLQLIPVGDSILYIRPVYVQAQQGSQLPAYRFVIVVYKNNAVFGQSLQDALAKFPEFAGLAPGQSTTPPVTGGPSPSPAPQPSNTTVQQLLARAGDLFNQAQAALTAGDLGKYQSLVNQVGDVLRQAQQQAGAGSATPTTSTTAPRAGGQQALVGSRR